MKTPLQLVPERRFLFGRNSLGEERCEIGRIADFREEKS